MNFDDLGTGWVIYCQFVGADSTSDISFTLNNDFEAQDRYKDGIIPAEMSYGNGAWASCPSVTLTPGQLYMGPRYP